MTAELPDDAEIFVRVKDLRSLFDMVCTSMDFGSGFLDTDDVEITRRVAVLLEVDPIEATPSNHRQSYKHTFAEYESRYTERAPWLAVKCRYCSLEREAPVHA